MPTKMINLTRGGTAIVTPTLEMGVGLLYRQEPIFDNGVPGEEARIIKPAVNHWDEAVKIIQGPPHKYSYALSVFKQNIEPYTKIGGAYSATFRDGSGRDFPSTRELWAHPDNIEDTGYMVLSEVIKVGPQNYLRLTTCIQTMALFLGNQNSGPWGAFMVGGKQIGVGNNILNVNFMDVETARRVLAEESVLALKAAPTPAPDHAHLHARAGLVSAGR